MRNAENPVKMRAQRRAREIGKTLGQVYREAGCNKAYLSEVPKTGWRENKLRAIATALAWTLDELMQGDAEERTQPDDNELFEMAIEVATDLLARAGNADAPSVGRLSRLIYEVLRELSAGGLQVDRQSVTIWCRRLMAALRTVSTASG
jgi:hypothetical protein